MKKKLMKHQCFHWLSFTIIVFALMLGVSVSGLHAQNALEITGWFSITWGDSEDGRSSTIYMLTDTAGQKTILQLDNTVREKLGGVLKFNGSFVKVQGALITPSILNAIPEKSATKDTPQISPQIFDVKAISIVSEPESKAPLIRGVTTMGVSGSKPWVTIMCKFSGISVEPNDVAYFENMYLDTYPGLNHYWKELSFETINIDGSGVGGTDWYNLPEEESFYNPTDTEKGTDLSQLAIDCIAAADDDVDFSGYSGILMVFNSDFDNGWAWGGSRTYTLDGVTKTWSTTWQPPWSYQSISVIAHEMGHGFGLPHSTAPGGGVYDNPWDVMSQDRYNCSAATDPTYGCVAQHTISYHKDILDWIPSDRKMTLSDGQSDTVILEDLAAPASSNYQMVKIPIGVSATNFYTVEARLYTGYDVKLPDEGVVIHKVDTTADEPAVLEPYAGNRENPWYVGETFTDEANSIAVIVKDRTGTGFEVTVSNGNLPPTSEPGGPYSEECMGPETTVVLDGSGSSDPEGDTVTYEWSTTCDGTFDDPTAVSPALTVNSQGVCSYNCSVSLVVTDDEGLSGVGKSTIVTISDTTSPDLFGVPDDATVECDAVPEPADVTGTDLCDAGATLDFEETRTDGSCADSYTLTRKWTATDGCLNEREQVQTITVVDSTPPEISSNAPATIVPPDAPISFIATAVDNCDDSPLVEITGYDCYFKTKQGRLIDKKDSCVVEISGDQITILDSGGVGTTITWTIEATDDCNNLSAEQFDISVIKLGN